MGDSDLKYSQEEKRTVLILNNCIYKHKVLHVNYMTYDLRHARDTFNATTHTDFMILSHDDEDDNLHPYWYGRILGIYHVILRHIGPQSRSNDPQTLQFLHVRWFGMDREYTGGWKARRLHQIGFVQQDDPLAFGFLDPSEIIRGVHLVPAFTEGRTDELLGPSRVGRPSSDNDSDWLRYYVEM